MKKFIKRRIREFKICIRDIFAWSTMTYGMYNNEYGTNKKQLKIWK